MYEIIQKEKNVEVDPETDSQIIIEAPKDKLITLRKYKTVLNNKEVYVVFVKDVTDSVHHEELVSHQAWINNCFSESEVLKTSMDYLILQVDRLLMVKNNAATHLLCKQPSDNDCESAEAREMRLIQET